MTSKCRRPLYLNSAAKSWTTTSNPGHNKEVFLFHNRLPNFKPTNLINLDAIAKEIGVKAVYVKDESNRCGGRAFKILGASWAAFRAIITLTGHGINSSLDKASKAAREAGITLLAASAGNHGIAVATSAKILGIKSRIYVSNDMKEETRGAIRAAGAEIIVVQGGYDEAVILCEKEADGKIDILVQDTAFEGYEEIPQWVVDGYSTMMAEIDCQLEGQTPDLVIVPVGVGSLAQAVVSHYHSNGSTSRVLAVESDATPSLWKCLQNGKLAVQAAGTTIMAGMNCSTVSSIAWPVLSVGLDACVTVSDFEVDSCVRQLSSFGVSAGPCGGAPLAALRHVSTNYASEFGLDKDSVVVLLCTEAPREYDQPFDVSMDDPLLLTESLVRINSSNPGSSGASRRENVAITRFIAAWLEHRDIDVKNFRCRGYPSSSDIQDGGFYACDSYDLEARTAESLIELAQIKEA